MRASPATTTTPARLAGVNVFLDVDQVLYPYVAAIVDGITAATGKHLPSGNTCSHFDLTEALPITRDEWHDAHRMLASNRTAHHHLNPLPGAVTAVRALHAEGAIIRLLTSREQWTAERWPELTGRMVTRTTEWVDRHFPETSDVLFAEDKAGTIDRYLPGAPCLLVDDDINHVTDVQALNGATGVLFDHPYNRQAEAAGLPRLYGWLGNPIDTLLAALNQHNGHHSPHQPAGVSAIHL